jgi:hypothetical protein
MVIRVSRAARWGSLVLLVLLTSAACGSTVDPSRLRAFEADPGSGFVEPGIDPVTGEPITGPTGDGGPGDVPGDGVGDAGTPTIGPTGGPAAPGIGVTKDTINIGIVDVEDQSEANAAFGAGAVTGGEGHEYTDAVLDDMNARGGIAGHKVIPIYDSISAVSNETFDAQLASVCETFTRDHKVYIVNGIGQSESFASCLESKGVAQVVDNLTNSDERTFRRYPHYVEVKSMSLNRIAKTTVESLYRRGYFSSDARVGVLTYDSETFDHALRTSLLPALAAHGVQALVRQVTENDRLSDLSNEGAQTSSVVLAFNSAGVDHVIILERSGTLALFFMNAADGQEYTPTYGLNSQSGNSAIVSLVPERQLHGALSIGWTVSTDLSPEDGAKAPKNASHRRCIELMNKRGLTFDSTNAEAIALATCDSLWLAEVAIEAGAVDGEITADSYLNGLNSLGTSFPASDGFGTRFSPTQHDGLAQVADMAYVEGCTCFRYLGPPYSVP